MAEATTVHGIVLTSMPMGECDRRLSILTKEYGKVSAFAKGARRQNSALVAVSQPFTYAEFKLYMGRTSNTLVGAEKANFFMGLRNDLDAMYMGMYFCELVDYLTREGNDDSELMALLYVGLKALEKTAENADSSNEDNVMPRELVRRVFELKAISLFGEAPSVFRCAVCGGEIGAQGSFAANKHGVLCGKCAGGVRALRLSESSLYALQFVEAEKQTKLFSFKLSEAAEQEFCESVEQYMKLHVDRPMKSLEVISQL